MATYVISNKRILISGLNVDFCVLTASYNFDSFPKDLVLFKVLWLNDNRLYDTPVNLQDCNLQGIPNF